MSEWDAFPAVAAKPGASEWDAFPAVKAAPISANNVVRAAATGVPIVGGALNKLEAVTNATLAPVLNPLFDEKNQLNGNWRERYAKSLAEQEGNDQAFAEANPITNTVANIAGGTAALAPVGATALGAKALGLTGSVPGMALRGAASGAALSAADAAVRGEDPVTAAEIGSLIGGAAGPVGRAIGKGVSAIADRVRPAPTVPQNVAKVAGVDVPLSQSQVTQNPALSAEEQVMLRGGRGEAAQENAQTFKDLQDARVNAARENIAAGLNPGANIAPQDAAERISAELIAKEQAQQAARAGVHAGPMSPVQQSEDLARHFEGGAGPAGSSNDQAERIAAELVAQEQARQAAEAANRAAVAREGGNLAQSLTGSRNVLAPHDVAENLSDRIAAARNAAKADIRTKYDAMRQQPGEFAPGAAAGFREDVASALKNAENPVDLDPTNTSKALQALDIIDREMGSGGPGQVAPAADLGSQHARNVADIAEKYGDKVAAAYDRQMQAAQPKPNGQQSLLEFLASKGGLGPDAELEAIGAHGHTVNVEGAGRRKLVRQGGWPLDYAREAAEEAGYLRGDHNGTSSVNDLLDAIDAEMRGQKRYPEGFEDYQGKRETVARTEREQHDFDRHMQGFADDLAAAGHDQLGPDVKQRAIHLMANEGMDADTAVDHALRQLEQEDAARVAAHSDFPGDNPKVATAEPEETGSAFSMRQVDQVRKRLVSLYRDARQAMMAGGQGADVRAMEHIIENFDTRVEQMVEQGKFSGDGPKVLQMLRDARSAFADYKAKFAKRGPGDEVGAAVEKILGKYSDTKATPDTIVKLAYGSGTVPGGQMPVQIAQRIASIFGRDSGEFTTYKHGLFAKLMEGEPEKAAARINEFLNGTKGRLLAQTVFSPEERSQLSQHASRLLSTLPGEELPTPSANKILRDLMGANGTGAVVNGPEAALALKSRLSPEGWNRVRTMAYRELTREGDPAQVADRIDAFLNSTNSKNLANTVFDAKERANLAQYAKRLRASVPAEPETGTAAAAIRRYTGADGALPASPQKIISDLMGASGKGTGVNAPLIAQGLKKQLSPERWNDLRLLAFRELTEAGEGKIPYEAQALSQRMHEFLNGDGAQLAKAMFTEQERDLMGKLAAVYKQMIPVKGTTNPSGTAPMLARMAGGLRQSLLPLLGFAHGGVPGAGVAFGIDKALTAMGNAKNARKATELFYGAQPRRPVNPKFARGAGLVAHGALPAANQ